MISVNNIAESNSKEIVVDPTNPRRDIFKNGYSYKLFMELKQLIVKEETALQITAKFSEN